MAQRFLIKKRFHNRVEKVVSFLEEEWNKDVAIAFYDQLYNRISAIVENPEISSPSARHINLRSLPVTKHNRLFYRI